VAATINQNLSLGAAVKPPNDIYIGARKVAGILLELRGTPQTGILGIGINVNHSLADFPEELREKAGSLAMIAGRTVDRHELASALLRDLDQTYRAALDLNS
jgi:BirA family biotin operon repressor/biotin-[acetyl-CoA-carboxylase] ligase